MGLILKREEVIHFLKENDCCDGTENIVWANIKDAQGPMVVLVFNETGILTLPITPLGKIEGDIIIVRRSEIKNITFKKGIIAHKIKVESSESVVPTFRVNKMMIGYKKQGEELDAIISQNKFF